MHVKSSLHGPQTNDAEHLSTTSQRQLLRTMQDIKILNNQRHGTFKYQFWKATLKNNARASKSWTIKDVKFKYHFTKATLKSNVRHQNLEQSLLLATIFFLTPRHKLIWGCYSMSTQFVPLTLSGPKMGTNSFGNTSFMQPMRRLSMHLTRSQVFFSFGGGGLFFPLFSMCSPWDYPSSQVVPQEFQVAPQFYPIKFAQSSTLMVINHVYIHKLAWIYFWRQNLHKPKSIHCAL